MEVLAVSGGTRNGNNDSICKTALMGAKEAGAHIEFIRLHDLNLKHCTGCGSCMKSLFSGQGGGCVLRDDFEWLRDKILNAGSVIFSIPVFEKGAAGIFHTLLDRFGPGHDTGVNITGRRISKEAGGREPDPRLFHKKTAAFFGTGGTDYVTRFQCDCRMLSTLMLWETIACEAFDWVKCIELEDDRIARVFQIGKLLASKQPDALSKEAFKPGGVCPHCGNSNFYLRTDGSAECCLCGIKGRIETIGETLRFVFKEEQLSLAYDTLEGKLCHAEDIRRNQAVRAGLRAADDLKQRKAYYASFISASLPVKRE